MKRVLKIFLYSILIIAPIAFVATIFVFQLIQENQIGFAKDLKNIMDKTTMAMEKDVNAKTDENGTLEADSENQNTMLVLNEDEKAKIVHKLNDWRLVLVNYENSLPENFSVELAKIDSQRQFDSRAIGELNQMLKDAKKARVGNLWVQSAYRSLEKQEDLYNAKIAEYMAKGLDKEEAERRTLEFINKPNTSEHNLGLAVDFNYVDVNFENEKAFNWLNENAENYGFILRYRQDKEEITKVSYEPWHWRYVGVEHAKKINELDMCLEEYVKFLEES